MKYSLAEYKECSRGEKPKMRFRTARIALKAISRLKKAGRPYKTLIAYECRFCGYWHTGNRREINGQ